MTVERLRVELGEDKNFVYSTINAVAHRNINKPVTPSNWYLETRNQDIVNVIKMQRYVTPFMV